MTVATRAVERKAAAAAAPATSLAERAVGVAEPAKVRWRAWAGLPTEAEAEAVTELAFQPLQAAEVEEVEQRPLSLSRPEPGAAIWRFPRKGLHSLVHLEVAAAAYPLERDRYERAAPALG
jgi:hypothetical protein